MNTTRNMSWGLTEKYFQLYMEYKDSKFTVKEASETHRKPQRATTLDLHKLAKNLALIRIEKGRYVTVEPDKWAGMMATLQKFPGLRPFFEYIKKDLPHINSILLYGSRARGDSEKDSDYDIILVTDGSEVLTEEQEEELRKQGFEVTSGHITDLRERIKSNPVFLVPALRESWPIFNGKVKRSLLKSFRRYHMMKDLQDILNDMKGMRYTKIEDLQKSMVYLLFSRARHLFLIDTIMTNREYYKKDFYDALAKKWDLEPSEVKSIQRAFNAIAHDQEPDLSFFSKNNREKMVGGNLEYFGEVVEGVSEAV